MTRSIILVLATMLQASAAAQLPAPNQLLLSDKYGRAITIGSQQDARGALEPSDASGIEAVDAFHAICLADGFDATTFAKAVPELPAGLQPQQVLLEPLGKMPAFRQDRFIGRGVVASWWGGNEDGLKGRPIAIRDRGVTTTGAYGPFKAVGRQCNVSFKLTRVGDLQAMLDHVGAVTRAVPIKVVVKSTWADGSWTLPGTARRISLTVVDGATAALVHFTVQDIEGAKP